MKNSLSKFAALLAVGFAALAAAPSAQAVSIRLTSGAGDTGILTDNLGIGQAIFAGSVGAWNVNTSVGSSKPIVGNALQPVLSIFSLNTTFSGTTDALRILVSDTGFTGSPLSFLADISASLNTNGVTAVFNTYADAGNAPFGLSTPLTTSSGLAGLFVDSDSSGSLSFANPYSLTLEVILTGTTPNSSVTFDASLRGVPEGGATLSLLGGALLGVGLIRRKLRKS